MSYYRYRCMDTDWLKNIKLTFGNSYLKYMHDDALMAVIFGYRKPLFEKIRFFSYGWEMKDINLLEKSYPLYIYMSNGNLIISNEVVEGFYHVN